MAKQTGDLRIERMTQDELRVAIDWARQEGWNPGLDDVAAFYAADPQGFLIGKLDQQPVASISAVRYGSAFAFIGLYIVEKSHRGRGYGMQLWTRALECLKGRNIGLDGVLAQQDNYRKSGFTLAHRNIRFAGRTSAKNVSTENIVDLASIDMSDLTAYDRRFFPAPRTSFLQAWIHQAHGHALGIVENDRLVAYGVIRACHEGYKIGPLNAESKDLALELFSALTAKIPSDATFYLDVPEPNAAAIAIAESHGMRPCFETARMYTGAAPDLPLHKIFGITSFELG
ncbi:MAG: GNAT family N-acetyltransferase [Pseudomonadota bacterium]